MKHVTRFKCKRCGGDMIEEILADAVVSSVVSGFNEFGDVDYQSWAHEVWDGRIDRFQCNCCGTVIKDEHSELITDYETLWKYALGQGWIKEVIE